MRAGSSVRFVANVAISERFFPLGSASADDVLRGAASAAQDARSTDGSVALYSPTNDTAHRRQYRLLQDFGAPLETPGQLRLVYQPSIALATGRCAGDVSPAEFIPLVAAGFLARASDGSTAVCQVGEESAIIT